VQHHLASRDHYDFRLEWDGALKSWAVPKGPSLNPADKRLAVQVEDHPLEYRHFEGTIPKGEYGGGTVMLWDEGAYEPLEFSGDAIKVLLHGERLRGKWALVRMKGQKEDKNWLLMKEKDAHSRDAPGIQQFTQSVRTMEEIAAGGEAKAAANPFASADVQLASLVSAVPREEEGWVYELKYDGYRILAYAQAGGVRLATRNGGDYTKKFQAAADAIAQWAGGRAMVLDGEMVVMDPQGRPDFQALQSYIRDPGDKPLQYMIFDLLALDGEDLRPMPLHKRKEMLEELLRGAPEPLRYSAHILGNGGALLRMACQARLEGIVGKRADSPYAGARNGDWIIIKCGARQEFAVGGYAVTAKRASGISSLLLGVYRDGALVYCGQAGGFSQRDMDEMGKKFAPIVRKTCPFKETPRPRAGERAVWLRPQFAAEVAFSEWTREGLLRQAKFKGLREDKDVRQIKREGEDEVEESRECVVEGVRITHPEKLVSQEPAITKKELALYYKKIAPRMLPFVRERILSAIRCPGGAESPCFFKKHPGAGDEGVIPAEIAQNGGGRETYYYIGDAFGLLSEVQMNTVEFHTWASRVTQLEQPDVMVFDLDPDEGMDLDTVRQGVRDLKGVLDGLALRSYLKTSGGKGYHVVVPFQPAADWEAFRGFAKGVAQIMEAKWPQRYVTNVRKVNRRGRIFIDWIRNTRGATSAAPYSVRKRPGLPVSMPIQWGELGRVAPDGIHMEEALQRLRRKDPWADFFDTGQQVRQGAGSPAAP